MTKSITVNNQEISITTIDSTDYVAVKPIYEAIGVAYSRQFKKLKKNEIIAPTLIQHKILAKDNKMRLMVLVPIKYVYGLYFTMNSTKVDPKIEDVILNLKRNVYESLATSFLKKDTLTIFS